MSRRALLVVVMGMVLAFVLGIGSTGIALAQAPSKPITITWWINPWRIAPPGFPPDKAPAPRTSPVGKRRVYEASPWRYSERSGNQPGFDQKIAAHPGGQSPDLLRPIGFQREWVKQGLLEPSTTTSRLRISKISTTMRWRKATSTAITTSSPGTTVTTEWAPPCC